MPHKRHLFCLHVCDISRISAYIFLWHETCYRQLIFLWDASRYSAVRKSKKAFAFLDCRAFALSDESLTKSFVLAQHFATVLAGTAHLEHIVPDFILEYYFSICSKVCPLVEECIIESFFTFLNGIKFCT